MGGDGLGIGKGREMSCAELIGIAGCLSKETHQYAALVRRRQNEDGYNTDHWDLFRSTAKLDSKNKLCVRRSC